MQRIHGHEVMKMMMQTATSYTRDSLRADILRTFGEDARFYTCSADNMTADELIDFLDSRGKFVSAGEGFQTSPDKVCEH